MNALGVATITHAHAPLDVLENVTYPGAELADALARLRARPAIADAAILSTCNRTEVYALFDGPADPAGLAWFLAEERGICWGRIRNHVRLHSGKAAVAHLFRVAAGLDSLAFGEAEIVAQVRAVHAELHASSRGELMSVFEAALRAGRAVRRGFDVGDAGSSLGAAAVAAARVSEGGRRVLVVGAGKIARSVLAALPPDCDVRVASRTPASAEALASGRGTAVLMDDFASELAESDAVFFCASSRRPILDAAVADAITSSRRSPLIAVDLGLPRNVAAEVRGVPGIEVVDLEGLRSHAVSPRRAEILAAVEPVIAEEVGRFVQASVGRTVGPLIEDIRRNLRVISEVELARSFPNGGPGRAGSQRVVRRIVGRVLHGAISEARRAALEGDVEALAALARAFGSPDPIQSIAVPDPSNEEEVA